MHNIWLAAGSTNDNSLVIDSKAVRYMGVRFSALNDGKALTRVSWMGFLESH